MIRLQCENLQSQGTAKKAEYIQKQRASTEKESPTTLRREVRMKLRKDWFTWRIFWKKAIQKKYLQTRLKRKKRGDMETVIERKNNSKSLRISTNLWLRNRAGPRLVLSVQFFPKNTQAATTLNCVKNLENKNFSSNKIKTSLPSSTKEWPIKIEDHSNLNINFYLILNQDFSTSYTKGFVIAYKIFQ